MIPFQFALLRYRHNASAGELVNVGVVMWIPNRRRLLFRVNDRYGRLASFFPGFDGVGYRAMVRQLRGRWEQAATELTGGATTNPEPESIDDLLPSLMREDASSFQWSPSMGGAVPSPERRLEQLFAEFVERHEARGPRERRDEHDVWAVVEQRLQARGLAERVSFGVELGSDPYLYKFRLGWQNGKTQVLEPISLDILSPTEMVEKANMWRGRLHTLGPARAFAFTGIVAPPQRADLGVAFERATAILRGAPSVRYIVTEEKLDDVLADIERDLAGDDHDD